MKQTRWFLIRDSTIAQAESLRCRKSVAIRIKRNGNKGVNGHLSPKNAKIQTKTHEMDVLDDETLESHSMDVMDTIDRMDR